MTDEEYVRTNWENISEGVVNIYLGDCESGNHIGTFSGWSAAAKFTRERMEQMRQLEAEINYLCAADYSDQHGEVSNDADEAQERTRLRLADALADLRRGMKE